MKNLNWLINRLKGIEGDCFNATLSAAGMNLAKLLKWLEAILGLIFARLLDCQRASTAAHVFVSTA